MKKALRERMARPADDHSTTVATTTHGVTTVPGHMTLSVNTKNVVAGSSSRTSVASLDLNQPASLGQHRSWTGHSMSSQHAVAATAGHYDRSAVHSSASSSSSSSLLPGTDSSYVIHRLAAARQFDARHNSTGYSQTRAPTANNHH